MREIRFRAWDNELKEMTTVMKLFTHGPNGNIWNREFYFKGAILTEPQSNRVELMQFTGLKDKNGKEIYEGDILRWNDKLWPVYYSERLAKYVMGTTKGCEIIGCGRCAFCEVIGNIYENPGLLKP